MFTSENLCGLAAMSPSGTATPNFAENVLERCTAGADSALPLPRLLLVLAHPDDEVLAVGARLERLAQSRLMTVTDGAPEDGGDARHHGFASVDAYRASRRAEQMQALSQATLPEEVTYPVAEVAPLPVADQTAAFHLAAITNAVVRAILAFAPEAVLTHPYEGGHPDHDACAFAVHMAVRRLHMANKFTGTIILESPFYHAGKDGGMETGKFLDHPAYPELIYRLTAQERATKVARLACFPSQAETLGQFNCDSECFRIAPNYDFKQPPHPGQLLCERFSWGITGEQFRYRAAEAEAEILRRPNIEHNTGPGETKP